MQDHTREELRKHLIKGDVNGVNTLLESGDIESPDQMIDLKNNGYEWTLLMWACWTYQNHNDISLITSLVKNHNANVNAQGTGGLYVTAVHIAIAGGLVPVLRFLVEEGRANLELRNRWGRTPLLFACGEPDSNEGIVKCLLNNQANINAVGEMGRTPLHYAAFHGCCSIARRLLADDRVNIEAVDTDGDTPLHLACYKGNAEFVRVLLSNSANPNARDHKFGRTPLICAVRSKNTSCIEAIIRAKVDLNKGDSDGQTALHHAVTKGNTNVLKLLLKAKADWSAEDNRNRLPVEMVKRRHRRRVVVLFVKALIGMVKQYEVFRNTVLRGATQETCLLKTLDPDVVPHIAEYCDVPTGDALEKIKVELDRLRPGHPRGQKRKHADV